MNYPRAIAPHLLHASEHFAVLMVTGARQVGKTTLLKSLSEPDRQYITLDDPLILSLAKSDPVLFLERFKAPLLIDEIQYAPELLPIIKMRVDSDKKPGQYWLTGSQPFHLMRGVSESLAGRVAVIQLLGFSRRESLGEGAVPLSPFIPEPEAMRTRAQSASPLSVQELFRLIWRGSFPAVVADPQMNRDLFYASYLQTYLQRDIRDLAKVGDEMAFLRFLRAIAARTGQLLNMAELARDADVAPNTAKNWLSIVEASGLVYLLQPWHNNVTKRLIKTPKLYFLDTGLCTYLTRWTSPQTLESGAMSGAIFETWAIAEVIKSYWHQGQQAPLYFFRNKDQVEIDLLIEKNGVLYALECKKTASPHKSAMKGLSALRNLGVQLGPAAVLCMVEQSMPLSREITAEPLALV